MNTTARHAALSLVLLLGAPLSAADEEAPALDWSQPDVVTGQLLRAVRVEVGTSFPRWGVPIADDGVRRRLAHVLPLPESDVPPTLEDAVGVTYVLPDGLPVHASVNRAGGHISLRDPATGEWRRFAIARGVLDEAADEIDRARFRTVRSAADAAELPADTLAVAVQDPAALPALARFTELRAISLFPTGTDDDDLARIPELPALEFLYLRGPGGYGANVVTDAGAAHLGRLRALRTLCIGATSVTDAGLRHLGGLRRLERLEIDGCPVTVAGLRDVLGSWPALRELNLMHTESVRVEELAELAPQLARCRIVLPWGQRTLGSGLPAFVDELRTLRSFTGESGAEGDAVHHFVQTAEHWRRLWSAHADGPAPAVDFDSEAVLAIVTEPMRVWAGMSLTHVIRKGEYQVTYHVRGPSGVDPGLRRLYGFFVVPRPERDIRLFSSRRAGPGPASVEQQRVFRAPR